MLISLLHPSRGRPEKAFDTLYKWWKGYMRDVDFEHILSIDKSDPYLSKYLEKITEDFNVIVNDNKSVVEATNEAAKQSKGNILTYLSDDFSAPSNWIDLIEKEFEGVTEPMLLKVHDCLQDFKARVVTIPIMNRALYEKLNYFWHPEYKSMWVDCDLYETCARLKCIKFAPHLEFPHLHHSTGKAPNDDTYKRSEKNWDQGLKVFERRKREGFPV